MPRGVAQLLYTYLPGKMVDWEDGFAIVRLTNARLANLWDDHKARLVLEEIASYLDDWRERGGRVHPNFPDPRATRSRLTVGEPASIAATPAGGALVCRSCARLVFRSSAQLARSQGTGFVCPSCNKRTLRQFGQVLVHGCGELVEIEEFLPWMKQEEGGGFRESALPLKCPNCGPRGVLVTCPRCLVHRL